MTKLFEAGFEHHNPAVDDLDSQWLTPFKQTEIEPEFRKSERRLERFFLTCNGRVLLLNIISNLSQV
jgi:hypothetical protein